MPKKKASAKKAPAPKRTLSGILLRFVAWSLLAMGILGAGAGVAGYHYFNQGLPDVAELRSLNERKSPQVTRVLAADGTVIAEIYKERRTTVPREKIPDVMISAVLSAEDADFYQHEGLDYWGMGRALLNSAKAGHVTGSGSTITQQVVKNLVLTPEKTFQRKAKELILARRIEQALTKDEILTLYLNAVYFGHGRYGVQEAARFYFGKDVSALTVVEAATIAGVIQSPERLSPRKHPERCKERRAYVLNQMAEKGFITEAAAKEAMGTPIKLAPAPQENLPEAGWFVDVVKKQLVDAFGEEKVLEGGLRVETTLDIKRQRVALAAVQHALLAIDERQGFGHKVKHTSDPDGWHKKAAAALKNEPPPFDKILDARVSAVNDGSLVLDVGTAQAEIPLENLDRYWPHAPLADAPKPKGKAGKDSKDALDAAAAGVAPGDVLPHPADAAPWQVGDILQVRLRSDGARPPEVMRAELAVGPQASFVAIDPRTREVKALVGGESYVEYPFDRITQSKRQPGSTFKPFVYGAALASRKFTAASIMLDAPESFSMGPDKWWKPENFSGKYEGPLRLRKALAKSINTVAIKLIASPDVGVQAVQQFAMKAGLPGPLVDNLTLALGSSEVRPIELANAYATLAADGRYAEIRTIKAVSDPDGPLDAPFLHAVPPEQRLPEDEVWVLRNVMRSVITEGTGTALKNLPRPLVGKTGTTNNARDAWFVGLLPDQVMVAWLGFDDNRTLGRKETGGQAAVPIVKTYAETFETSGPDWPPPPAGVVIARIDPTTGLLLQLPEGSDDPEGAGGEAKALPGLDEAFLAGTVPTLTAAAPGEVTAQNFLEAGTEDSEAGPGEGAPSNQNGPNGQNGPISGPAIATPTIKLSPLPGALMPEVDAAVPPAGESGAPASKPKLALPPEAPSDGADDAPATDDPEDQPR